MGFGNGPRIVSNGLVLALDAADKNSYPGSGITWRDVSGNNNNGTLTNGPTFDSSNGGSIVFDGTNDFVTGSIGSINAPFTFSVFGKFNNVSQTRIYARELTTTEVQQNYNANRSRYGL